MRKNWSVKVERRELRARVAERVAEYCEFSSVGKVTTTPYEDIVQFVYSADGVVRFGKPQPWIELSTPHLKHLLEADLHPIEPKPALVILAEQAE